MRKGGIVIRTCRSAGGRGALVFVIAIPMAGSRLNKLLKRAQDELNK